MNFKNADKPYLIIMFIFCLFNPIYFVGLFFAQILIKSENKFYEKFSTKETINNSQR